MLSTIFALALSSSKTEPMNTNFAFNETPAIRREFRAAWVATVDNIDWPTKPGLSADQQKSEMIDILDKLKLTNMNAIVFQIRTSADAMYESKFEPWSWYLTGKQGTGPGYDPLKFATEEAHKRGIEMHVWFNPYRAGHPAQLGGYSSDHISNTHPEAVYQYGGFKWMDPGQKWVQDRSYDVFMDVVKRYDIDGIHIDDYFYPYPISKDGKEVPFPDDKTFSDYTKKGGKLGKSDWRRKNVDDLIFRVFRGMKQQKPWLKFGISPFGIYRPGIPAGISAGIDQYEALSADALKWLKQGWCDYYTPQLYWPIEQEKQSFPVLLKWWREQSDGKVPVWPGLYTGRINPDDPKSWDVSQVIRQVEMTQQGAESIGQVHFSMKSLQKNWKGVSDELLAKVYKQIAIVPETNNPSSPPASPKGVRLQPVAGGAWNSIEWPALNGSENVKFYCVEQRIESQWKIVQVSSETLFRFLPKPGEHEFQFRISAMNRYGVLSVPTTVTLKI